MDCQRIPSAAGPGGSRDLGAMGMGLALGEQGENQDLSAVAEGNPEHGVAEARSWHSCSPFFFHPAQMPSNPICLHFSALL